ncbi:MAG: cytochrome c biogenesis protein ResB [Akkermansiaceae bacterium]
MSTSKPSKSLGRRVFEILSGYEIAVICFILLFLLTFYGTIEQSWIGLYAAIEKYFDIDSFIVFPRNGSEKIIGPPLPGAYWVIVVLSINMFLGGIIRIRKGWKKAGVLVTHFSILFMLVAGAVSSLYKKEGLMVVFEGEKSNYAQSYVDSTIEVFAYDENGDRQPPLIIPNAELRALKSTDTLTADFEELPFSLKITNYHGAAEMTIAGSGGTGKVVDGFILREVEPNKEEEANMDGCYVSVLKEGEVQQELLLWTANPQPVSFVIDNVRYGIHLPRQVWPMPFEVELKRSVGEYYPGTRKASWFQSDVTKVAEGYREDYEIIMNHPMRHGGYTLYQARWDKPEGRPFSGFAIVKNPSDKWPEYALYIATVAMAIHFLFMLFRHASGSRSKSSPKSSS